MHAREPNWYKYCACLVKSWKNIFIYDSWSTYRCRSAHGDSWNALLFAFFQFVLLILKLITILFASFSFFFRILGFLFWFLGIIAAAAAVVVVRLRGGWWRRRRCSSIGQMIGRMSWLVAVTAPATAAAGGVAFATVVLRLCCELMPGHHRLSVRWVQNFRNKNER